MSTAKLLETPTRERTMEIAARLFAQNGFKGVSMRDIANAVGIKAASLYNHFSDKEDLYLSSLEHAFSFRFEDLRQALDAVMADAEGAKLRRLRGQRAQLAERRKDWALAARLHRVLG